MPLIRGSFPKECGGGELVRYSGEAWEVPKLLDQ